MKKSLREILTLLVSKPKTGKPTSEDDVVAKDKFQAFQQGLSGQDRILENIHKQFDTTNNKDLGHPEQKKPASVRRLLYAAAAIFILSAGGYVVYKISGSVNSGRALHTVEFANKKDLKPGGNKATLKLSDGSVIILDSASNGNLMQEGSTQIIKLDGQLSYAIGPKPKSLQGIKYNTITTPRGGQYQIVLPDGSKVWLNAGSSITFPVSFPSSERAVTLTGEGYFEIAKDPTSPFKVFAKQIQLDVLGTSFNISAYDDEKSIKTTLLNGSIKVSAGNQHTILQPCQQTEFNKQGILTSPVKVDVYASVAWKEGYFYFKKATIQYIMQQLSRWYDVDISYEGDIPQTEFTGEIPKNAPASEVFNALKALKINFRISGDKKVVVMP